MAELVADATSVMHIGKRDRQEDAVIADFAEGSIVGLAVLSDGMGGHEDGDAASRIIASKMFSEMFFAVSQPDVLEDDPETLFRAAMDLANCELKGHAKAGHVGEESGGTLVSVALTKDRLRWISVGDSPLYIYRDRRLHRLNEDHSMAPQIDRMAREGQMDAETAAAHPMRNVLTSALTGKDIPRIDCPGTAVRLKAQDIVVLASDGINTLSDARIKSLIRRHRHKDPKRIGQLLMAAVARADQPDQDNTSIVVIKMKDQGQDQPAAMSAIGKEIAAIVDEQAELFVSALRRFLRLGAGSV